MTLYTIEDVLTAFNSGAKACHKHSPTAKNQGEFDIAIKQEFCEFVKTLKLDLAVKDVMEVV